LDQVDWPLYEEMVALEPFGMGNPTPVFGACGVRLNGEPRILKEKHLKLRVGEGASPLDALGWGWAARAQSLPAGQQVDMAFTVERNNYWGPARLQLIMKDIVATG
jgi:single-stranded-DNA-specific exonuclease